MIHGGKSAEYKREFIHLLIKFFLSNVGRGVVRSPMNDIKRVDNQKSPIKLEEVPSVLRKLRVRIDSFDRQPVDVDAVVQDSLPGGSCIGTVVGCHGTPGSHNDFKYILPYLHKCRIRFIGINFPGQGYTPHEKGLSYTNEERMQFVQKIINSMDISDNIVFLGHSRGSENALRLAARNPDRCKGVALVNPIGIKAQHSIKPTWIIICGLWLWETFRIFRFILRYLFYSIFQLLKMRVKSGDEAAICLKLTANIDLTGQMDYIKMLNNNKTKVLIAYSAMDHLIEISVSQQFASLFENINHVSCPSADGDTSILDYIPKQYTESDRSFSVCFENEGHYLQKYQAKFIANCIYSMLIAENIMYRNAKNALHHFYNCRNCKI
uniref:AB hydrolase-1 domain-containing protein n=1 Tax=Elaeophora elaphi TaxID=1147741 RepID=A0A0R3S007_9BILA